MDNGVSVTITGLDSTLIKIEGKFSSALDRKLLSTQGKFVREMDRAAARVFEAMAKDVQIGNIVARRVMGSHSSTPSFLIAEGATPWEKLTPKYLKDKKEKTNNTHFWQYTGTMIKTFRTQSDRMARMSRNIAADRGTGNGNPRPIFKPDPNDALFIPQKTIPAYGKNVGTRGKNYDFIYDTKEKAPQINYSASSKKSGAVPEKYVKQMRRSLEFNVFNGYANYVKDMLNGTTSSSPEDYIGVQRSGSQIIKNPKSAMASYDVTLNSGNFERRLYLKHKLWYRRNGQLKKRDFIQPYFKYFFKKVMLPLAKKSIKGMKV